MENWINQNTENGFKLIFRFYLFKFIDYIGPKFIVFTKGPSDWNTILGRVIPETQQIVLDASLFNTQHFKVRIKG